MTEADVIKHPASDDQELTQALERAMVEMRDLTNDLAISQRDLEGALAKINALAVELKALEDRNACLSDDLAISRREQDRLHQQLRAHDRQHAEDQNRIDALLDNIQQKPNAIQQSSATQEGKPMICVKEYSVLSECIERGISYGYNRAYKHKDNPDRETVQQSIHMAVMTEICEYFHFDDAED